VDNYNYHDNKALALIAFEYRWIKTMAVLFDGNICEMARQGGVDRGTLYRLVRKHGFTRQDLDMITSPGSPDDEAQ